MKPIDDKKDKVVIAAVSRDEKGRKKVEKAELRTHDVDTVKYIEKKLVDKGVQRLDRHPADGIGGIGRPPPKSGHGGKYTWEGPTEAEESELDPVPPAIDELDPVPPAIDERDPNYVEEEAEDRDRDEAGLVVGEVEVAKVAEGREGVARIEVDPHLKVV